MDMLPEKKEYAAGETARFQVRMPFRAATALVTVEREGVLSSFVTELTGQEPVVEVPIADAMRRTSTSRCSRCAAASARQCRGAQVRRQRDEAVTALVDLTKPAIASAWRRSTSAGSRTGSTSRVTPDRTVYKVAREGGRAGAGRA